MDVRRTPRVGVIAPRIRARLNGNELVPAILVGERTTGTGEIGIEGRVPTVDLVPIAAGGIRLPDLDQRVANRSSIFIEHTTRHHHPLAHWRRPVLRGQIMIEWTDAVVTIHRTTELGQRLRNDNERLLRVPQFGGFVGRRIGLGMRPWLNLPARRQRLVRQSRPASAMAFE